MSRRGQGRCSNLVKNMLTYRSFREILVCKKGRGPAGKGYYEIVSRKISRKPYGLDHYTFKQHYAWRFMFAKFRKQQLQAYSFHSRDRPQPLMLRCGEIRKKNISKLWILVIMTKVGGGLPGGGDGILHGFEFLNIWMVRHEKGVRVRNGLLNRCDLPSQPFSTLTEMLRNCWEIFCPYSLYYYYDQNHANSTVITQYVEIALNNKSTVLCVVLLFCTGLERVSVAVLYFSYIQI